MKPLHVFCGYDAREAIGFHVCVHSMLARASVPVSVFPLSSVGLPEGSNSFTTSRFLVPWLMEFKGTAIFIDCADMLLEGDIAELAALADERFAVQVVKHLDYQTQHPIKYMGTAMQCENRNYSRKNWASCMVIQCGHPAWSDMTPERIASMRPIDLLQFRHIPDEAIGELPAKWNVLIDEGQESEGAKICHWTAGAPFLPCYSRSKGAPEWFREHAAMLKGPT